MKYYLLFLVLLHLAQSLYAQHKIELKIVDPDQNVIPGVTIEYGTTTYYTDLNGLVNVEINNKATLCMTHIAFENLVLYPQTLQDNRQRTLCLTLRHKYVNLLEVSVSGDNMINTLAEACGKINMPLTAYQAEVIQMVAGGLSRSSSTSLSCTLAGLTSKKVMISLDPISPLTQIM